MVDGLRLSRADAVEKIDEGTGEDVRGLADELVARLVALRVGRFRAPPARAMAASSTRSASIASTRLRTMSEKRHAPLRCSYTSFILVVQLRVQASKTARQ